MKSNKQRRAEIKQLRLARAARIEAQLRAAPRDRHVPVAGMVPADAQVLASINNSYFLPAFYLDKAFRCADCGAEEVWTAKQQKWWYEVMKASIDSQAKRCLPCRRARRARIAAAQAVPGANRLSLETEALRALGAVPPDAAALAQVAAALQSKWWSLRVVAIQVLGRWGGADQVAQLHAFVAARSTGGRRYFGWERVAADAAQRALAGRCDA